MVLSGTDITAKIIDMSTGTPGSWLSIHATTNMDYSACEVVDGKNVLTTAEFSPGISTDGEKILFGQPEKQDGTLFTSGPSNGICYEEDYNRYTGYELNDYRIINCSSDRKPFFFNAYGNGMMATDVYSACTVTACTPTQGGCIFKFSGWPSSSSQVASIVFPNGFVAECVRMDNVQWYSNFDPSNIDTADTGFLNRASVFPSVNLKVDVAPFYGRIDEVFMTEFRAKDNMSAEEFVSNIYLSVSNGDERRYYGFGGCVNGGICLKEPQYGDDYYGLGIENSIWPDSNINGIGYAIPSSDGESKSWFQSEVYRNQNEGYYTDGPEFFYDVYNSIISNSGTSIDTNGIESISDSVSPDFPEFIYLSGTGSSYKCCVKGDDVNRLGRIKFYADNGNDIVKNFVDFTTYVENEGGSLVISSVDLEEGDDYFDYLLLSAKTISVRIVKNGVAKNTYAIMSGDVNDPPAIERYVISTEATELTDHYDFTFNFLPLFKTGVIFNTSDALSGLTAGMEITSKIGRDSFTGSNFTFTLGSNYTGKTDGYPSQYENSRPCAKSRYKMASSIIGVYEIYDEKSKPGAIPRVKTRVIKIYTGKDIVIL